MYACRRIMCTAPFLALLRPKNSSILPSPTTTSVDTHVASRNYGLGALPVEQRRAVELSCRDL